MFAGQHSNISACTNDFERLRYDALLALRVADVVLPCLKRDGDRARGAWGDGAAELRLMRDNGRGRAHHLWSLVEGSVAQRERGARVESMKMCRRRPCWSLVAGGGCTSRCAERRARVGSHRGRVDVVRALVRLHVGVRAHCARCVRAGRGFCAMMHVTSPKCESLVSNPYSIY
jgi:hypothetical protein